MFKRLLICIIDLTVILTLFNLLVYGPDSPTQGLITWAGVVLWGQWQWVVGHYGWWE